MERANGMRRPPTIATRRTEDPTSMTASLCDNGDLRPACQRVRLTVKAVRAKHCSKAAMTTSTPSRFAADVRAICALGLPLLGNNLSIMGMQFADTVMAGQLGARD